MAVEKKGYLQCSYKLADEVKDVRIAVLAHKIYYKCNTGKKTSDGYVEISDMELANSIYVSDRTLRKFVTTLEEIELVKTKRIKGTKYYRCNIAKAKKYFI